MASGEVSISQALDNLGSGAQKNRETGVADLKKIFSPNSGLILLDKLKDNIYHHVFEALFRVASGEKQAYLSGKTAAAKRKAENNLTDCSDALRMVITAGAYKLKAKTVKAIIEHVIQLLPDRNESYCEGLTSSYFKILVVLFRRPANIEQLSLDDWQETVDFCLSCIQIYCIQSETVVSHLSSSVVHGVAASRTTIKATSSQKRTGVLTPLNAEELIDSLQSLLAASNAPIITRAQHVTAVLLKFLSTQATVSTVHKVVFQSLNHVLHAICGERLSLCHSIAQQIIPIVVVLWSSRTSQKDMMLNSVRDQMLIALLSLENHLEYLLASGKAPEVVKDLEELHNIFRAEYCKREERDKLQMSEIELSSFGKPTAAKVALLVGHLPLKSYLPEAERNWAILYLIGVFDKLLYLSRSPNSNDVGSTDAEGLHPRKRRRVMNLMDSLVEQLRSSDGGEQLMALQITLFVIPSCEENAGSLGLLIENLIPLIADSRTEVSSWAMLSMSIIAQQMKSLDSQRQLSLDWIQLWHTAARLSTSVATCRAACYLLHSILATNLLMYRDISDGIDTLLTATDISAPAIICDSSLCLMAHILEARNINMPNGSLKARQQLVIWLSSKWAAGWNSGFSYTSSPSPGDLIDFLRATLGLGPLEVTDYDTLQAGIIGQNRHVQEQQRFMLQYLLLLKRPAETNFHCDVCPQSVKLHGRGIENNDAEPRTQICRSIVEVFLPKFAESVLEFEADFHRPESLPNIEGVRLSISSWLFACLLQSTVLGSSATATHKLQSIIARLKVHSCSLLQYCTKDLRGLAGEIVQPYLPGYSTAELGHLTQHDPQLLELFQSAADLLDPDIQTPTTGSFEDGDSLDDLFQTTQTNENKDQISQISNRTNIGLKSSPVGVHAVVQARLVFIKYMTDGCNVQAVLSSSFVEYIEEMEDHQVLARQAMLLHLLHAGLEIAPTEAYRLIDRLGDIIKSPEYYGCEVALSLCLEAMTASVAAWTDPDGGEFTEISMDLYHFFVEKLLTHHQKSIGTESSLANLFAELMRSQSDLELSTLQSPRTSLLFLLRNASLQGKFSIEARIPGLFELFVLHLHNQFLDDIMDSLPTDPDWVEGILFRVYVVGNLASTWPTLLRACVYYILEVPGHFPAAAAHATKSMSDVAASLGLEDTRELFRLFSSQLLYTWLEEQAIEKIPYMVFGYNSLEGLVTDCLDEIAGLLTMRDQDPRLREVASLLQMTYEEVLTHSFSKIIAYSVAHDISVPPRSSPEKYIAGEARVRKCLGKERFFELINWHFADILALLFKTTDLIEQIERYLSKKSFYRYAAANLQELRSVESAANLPPNQQPAFKAKYLTDEIEHLCRRTQFDVSSLYTPTMVVFIARSLLRSIHPALGSLYACATLRKLRVLIALSDDSCLHGYCLEMLLQSIRPFMTNSECADDAIGVMRYLFTRGTDYLLGAPSFVAGVSLSLLASLRVFLETSPASTTLGSQYRSTISKAQKFHDWFGSYLEQYRGHDLDENSAQAFLTIMNSVHSFAAIGNANVDTTESILLHQLLEDEHSGRNLLSKASRRLAFSLLFARFKRPTSFRDDILGSDALATKYAVNLWNLCQDTALSNDFLIWAAKTLGRSYAASGEVPKQFIHETNFHTSKSLALCGIGMEVSRSTILSSLGTVAQSNDQLTASIAESVIRIVIARLDDTISEAETAVYSQFTSDKLWRASSWRPFQLPPTDTLDSRDTDLGGCFSEAAILTEDWLPKLSIALAKSVKTDALLPVLPRLIEQANEFATCAFPFIMHLVLLSEFQVVQSTRKILSKSFRSWIKIEDFAARANIRALINTILYLRTQPMPGESSSADRIHWLDLDFADVSNAATRCSMFKTALLFLEISISEDSKTSTRRSSTNKLGMQPLVALVHIYKSIDDPDMFYGVESAPNLDNVLKRLEHERNGMKSLAFRSALYDTNLRLRNESSTTDARSIVGALDTLSFDGLSHCMVQSDQARNADDTPVTFHTARRLEQWDLPVPVTSYDDSAVIYKIFQAVNNAKSQEPISRALDTGIKDAYMNILNARNNASAESVRRALQCLAVMTEMDEVLSSSTSKEFEEMSAKFEGRAHWMRIGKFEDFRQITSCRQTLFSSLNKNPRLRSCMNVNSADTHIVEVQSSLLSSNLCRTHGALQDSLTVATYLNSIIEPCRQLGVQVEAAVLMEIATALWAQEEITASIGVLRTIDQETSLKKQAIPVGRPSLLAKLGAQISQARLEKSGMIVDKYLEPALRELKGNASGTEASHVFHEFAIFCDEQLQDSDNLADLARLKRLKEAKESEVADLGKLLRGQSSSEGKQKYSSHFHKAKQWLALDNDEYIRHRDSRQRLLKQSLENYLLCLTASDDYNRDALRFSVLWLQHSDNAIANDAVSKYIGHVPSHKFAPLMNQLTSRLLKDDTSAFQRALYSVILRICTEHPYHGMYQIWAACRVKADAKDEAAVSRSAAAGKLALQLQSSSKSSSIWSAINSTNRCYLLLAAERDEKYKQGQRIQVKYSKAATQLNNAFTRHRAPPPTLQVKISASLDYSLIPIMERLEPVITVASGVSAPKVVSVLATDGRKYKQLVKGGTDDLRQDAIMEQVFVQVSQLLQSNATTRQRNLGIRTYKVLPLSPNAGIIEFVPNSIPLHDYLIPAHEKYHPSDLKGSACRKQISDVQTQRLEVKIRTFRSVTERFHPVLRFFFMERFHDPEDWFQTRTAYTRSTAAMSILGHVLGLGDRHGHNILLDDQTGDVIHIDLGIAFEMGRVLPIPETVPFRLTRDIIDGMGINKTEGIFRRCCEFTLEALRKESSSIMAILDVLRYDPLYSWSISPVRLARLQNAQSATAPLSEMNAQGKTTINDAGEAERALSTTAKKLSKTLSVAATVNDLINQATDEKLLAALYSGWGAYV